MTDEHYYVFDKIFDGIPAYERTCGTEAAAKKRVKELQERGCVDAFYSTELPKDCFY